MTPKKHHSVPQPRASPLLEKLTILIVVVLLLAIIGLYLNYKTATGKAITLGAEPYLSVIDMEKEGSVSVTELPAERRYLLLKTSPFPVGATSEPLVYLFNLSRRDDLSYYFTVSDGISPPQGREATVQDFVDKHFLVEDVLAISGDTSRVYLNTLDPASDLVVEIRNHELVITNPYYLSSAGITINLKDATGQNLPSIIRVANGTRFSAMLNASAAAAPEIVVFPSSMFTLPTSDKWGEAQMRRDLNHTSANFTWNTPAESGAKVLDVLATVQGREAHRYYTFAVGDVVYALKEQLQQYPDMELKAVGNTYQLTVIFPASTNLQPFALPCKLTNDNTDAFVGSANINKIYSYNALISQPQVWTKDPAIPDDITQLVPEKGYFVQLLRPELTTITAECTVETIRRRASLPPDLDASKVRSVPLKAGWNLFALRGINSYKLADFVAAPGVRAFQCTLGYQCSELPADQLLDAGKPYWIYTPADASFTYVPE